ncbi:MAG: LLM class F420-dependent oxidoreductase [Bacillota bacterium]
MGVAVQTQARPAVTRRWKASPLRVGAMIPQGWLMDLPAEAPPQQQWRLMGRVARTLEGTGFDSGWLYDHFHTVPTPASFSVFECWTATSALLAQTVSLRIGQLVTCNSYRNPALLAKMAATADVISGGRLEFGIGAGWYEHEYRGYGYPFERASVRIRMLDEALQVIRRLWTEQVVTFEGRYYRLQNAYCDPKPLQRPRPSILVGGGGERLTLRVVARWADRANFGGSLDNFRHKADVLLSHCERVGRDPQEIELTYTCPVIIGRDRGAVETMVRRFVPANVERERYAREAAIGTPEEVAAFLRSFVDAGASYLILNIRGAAEITPLELFGERVLPLLRA